KVGNGRHTSFWNERWYGDILFKEKFPRIYALENCKDVSVAVKFSSVGGIQNYRREPRDGVEKQQFTEMNLTMNQICLAPTDDRWSWDLNGEGLFVVKDLRNLIDDFILPKEENVTRWIKYIPIKVNIFAWKVRCEVANGIMILFCHWWNIDWVPINSYDEWLLWFNSIRLNSKIKKLLEGACYVM
ncbi:hypothetical protein Tco_1270940, partial [Tanacetum coccineum]